MSTKTRNVLFIIAAALIIGGAIFGIVHDVTKDDVQPKAIKVVVDTTDIAPADTVAVDTLVIQ